MLVEMLNTSAFSLRIKIYFAKKGDEESKNHNNKSSTYSEEMTYTFDQLRITMVRYKNYIWF